MSPFGAAAQRLVDLGYSPIPLSHETGLPVFKGWDRLRATPLTPRQIEWWSRRPHMQVGVVGGFNGLVPIDVDTDHRGVWQAIRETLPPARAARRGSKGYILFFVDPTGLLGSDRYGGWRTLLTRRGTALIEMKARGNVTIPPSLHRTTRRPYRWIKGSLLDIRCGDLAVITKNHLAALERALMPYIMPREVYLPAPVTASAAYTSDKRMQACANAALERAVARVKATEAGRNASLYRASRTVAKFISGGFLRESDVIDHLLDAATFNGSAAAKGRRQCLLTIRSGIRMGKRDALPLLPDRQSIHAQRLRHG